MAWICVMASHFKSSHPACNMDTQAIFRSNLPTALYERIYKKVHATQTCHIWTGSIQSGGYPNMWVKLPTGGKTFLTHRIVYTIVHGHCDGPVSHLCGNKRCVNWEHLRIEDPAINQSRNICHHHHHCQHHARAPDCIIPPWSTSKTKALLRATT